MDKKIIYFSVGMIILFLLISFVVALTPEQLARGEEGLITKVPFPLGGRTFTPPSGEEGYVKILEDGVFAVRNMKVTTGDVQISSSSENIIFLIFTDTYKKTYTHYLQIVDAGNTKKVTLNGKPFTIKKEMGKPQFILDHEGNLIEGTHFTVGESSILESKNVRFTVPAEGKVKYEKGKITVTIKAGSEVALPTLIDSTKKAEVTVEYVVEAGGEEGMTLAAEGKKLKIKGRILDGKRHAVSLFFDPIENRLYVEEANFDGVFVGLAGEEKNKRIYLFTDGERPKDFKQAYFSIDKTKKKVSFGVPAGHRGIFTTFMPGNNIIEVKDQQSLILRALGDHPTWNGLKKESNIEVAHQIGNNLPPAKISTQGPFQLWSGKMYVLYEPMLKPKVPQYWIYNDKTEGSVALQLLSKESDGSFINYDLVDNGKPISRRYEKNIFTNEENFASFMTEADYQQGEFARRVKISSLSGIEQSIINSLQRLSEDKQKQFLGTSLSVFLAQLDISQIKSKLNEIANSRINELTAAAANPNVVTPQVPTTPTQPQTPPVQTPPTTKTYGTWEKTNVEGYKSLGGGYFSASVGGNTAIKYVSLEKLKEISTNKRIPVKISEPSHCTHCVPQVNGRDTYLTIAQAEHIGGKINSVPATIYVKDGKVVR